MSDGELIERFISHKRVNQGKSEKLAKVYGAALQRLATWLDGRGLLSASSDELEAFAGPYLHKQGLTAVSRRPYISAVRGFYQWASVTGLMKVSPAGVLAYPKVGWKIPRVMTLDQAERLMWAPDLSTFVGVRDAAIIAVFLGCGLRLRGLLGLNESQLLAMTYDGQPRMVVQVTEKGGRQRRVPVPAEAEMLLRLYLGHPDMEQLDRTLPDGDQVLFVSTNDRVVSPDQYRGARRRLRETSVWKSIRKYGRRAGLPPEVCHPHAMRHLFGTELYESEVDQADRQNLLGHADPKSTAIYTHIATRRKFKAIDRASPLSKVRTPVSELIRRIQKG